ncbi:hypothetical protein [Flavisphingopyxis soli]|uniref:hypothetical protein n=1 Tax=Flavisphingopyxis soli TaxID=2601267 RepID=UPI0013762B48|nr:hypothetical protein [Sphingorhabdus soli]
MRDWSKNDWSIEDIDAQLPQPRRCEDPRPIRARDLALTALVIALIVLAMVVDNASI